MKQQRMKAKTMRSKGLPIMGATGRIFLIASLLITAAACGSKEEKGQSAAARSGEKDSSAAVPALSVAVTQPRALKIPVRLHATGNIAAWHEAVVGTETNGLRLKEVNVETGDSVRRGQVMATFEAATVVAELAQSRAAVNEASAALAEATANADRARGVKAIGVLSEQLIDQLLTAERMAHARLDSAKAASQAQELRLAQTKVLSPDDGVVSARSATVGAVLPAGQELFRIFRRDQLEWQAEVFAPDLVRLRPGQSVTLTPVGGQPIKGKLRKLAPGVDAKTRNGLAYVDIQKGSAARAGMFARGEIELGDGDAELTLPQSAVVQRDGFNVVFLIGPDSRVVQTKVTLGKRADDHVEVLDGLRVASRVVASGGGFLSDGDLVRTIDEPVVLRNGKPSDTSASK